MYQTNHYNKSSKDFDEAFELFNSKLPKGLLEMTEDTSKWDITAEYKPNWACMWNKPSNMGRPCMILEKNQYVALVAFADKDGVWTTDMPKNLYRLEDLTLVEPGKYAEFLEKARKRTEEAEE